MARSLRISNIAGVAAFAAALVTALGCGDSVSTSPNNAPKFEATVSGAADHQLSGSAMFSQNIPGFGIALVQRVNGIQDSVRHAVYFRRLRAGVLAPGMYSIVSVSSDSAALLAVVVLRGDSDNSLLCTATDGSLHIDDAKPELLSGQFTMTASCTTIDGTPVTNPINVAGSFNAANGTFAPPPEPEVPLSIDGSRFVLRSVNGQSLPLLYQDLVDTDNKTRLRAWLVADTIRFGVDDQLTHATYRRQLEESTDSHAVLDDYEFSSARGGYYRTTAREVRVAWAFISRPSEDQYRDTLRVRSGMLVRMAPLPPSCFVCPQGARVEYVYEKR